MGRGLLTGVRDEPRALGNSAGVPTGLVSCGIRQHGVCREAEVPGLALPSVLSMLLPQLGLNKLHTRTGVEAAGVLRLAAHPHEDVSSVHPEVKFYSCASCGQDAQAGSAPFLKAFILSPYVDVSVFPPFPLELLPCVSGAQHNVPALSPPSIPYTTIRHSHPSCGWLLFAARWLQGHLSPDGARSWGCLCANAEPVRRSSGAVKEGVKT